MKSLKKNVSNTMKDKGDLSDKDERRRRRF
jgi:hypothetical protein